MLTVHYPGCFSYIEGCTIAEGSKLTTLIPLAESSGLDQLRKIICNEDPV